ncbi:CynX/NimT family MFS transporter [Paenibacillus radicis (ex Gao et al. 2016)]|uniref:MFS transporter n=1 Tax=Paenibacillus radicis (ex Gao et al. 2016) TaxID=1737354 RepID=A0A917H698_9BACL|nr:MFS transporter [Paenibacillus radicis (ex Gao et al. 2016)]GGG68758.1 MFS transporter [Paenibacillus radicis (ex Gao et al. 2016)]
MSTTAQQAIAHKKLEQQKASWLNWPLLISLIILAANMRAPITGVGSLIGDIKGDLSISNGLAGVITAMPLIAFALLSPFAPKLSQRFGLERVLALSALTITVGIIVRSLGGVFLLMLGTILFGMAIAVCNVLLPSLVKTAFPSQLGLVTGFYTVAMNLCGALASGVSVPLAHSIGLGWRGSLMIWAVLAGTATILWLLRSKEAAGAQAGISAMKKGKSLWRNKLAWSITLYMGLQSMVFYVIAAWLPEILQERGIGAEQAGWMLSFMQFAIMPVTFIVPIIAGKLKDQRGIVGIIFVLLLGGLIGLIYGSNTIASFSTIILGIGSGAAFSLAMMFFTLRSNHVQEAAELSGMAQSVGYMLAALGPIAFGVLHDITHSWTTPLYTLIVVIVFILSFGLIAAKNRTVQ